MRARGIAFLVFACTLAAPAASAQVTQKCSGESWSELAGARYGEARYATLLAIFNRAPGTERCAPERFIRFPGTIRHELLLGQSVSAVVARFTRAAGGEAVVRERNRIPPGVEPPPGTVLELPTELALAVGTRPEQELAAIYGAPSLEVVRRFNGLAPGAPLPAGGTIYLPIFLQAAAPPPPPSAASVSPPAPDAGAEAASDFAPVAIAAVARAAGFEHPAHAAVMPNAPCSTCHVQAAPAAHAYLPIADAVCTRCHAGAEPTDPVLRVRRLALSFDHALHSDPAGKLAREGYAATCVTCHPSVEASSLRKNPAHAECVRCHNSSEVTPSVTKDCDGCHARAETLDRFRLARSLLHEHFRSSERLNDVHFEHDTHVRVLGGEGEASCDRCHASARSARTLLAIEPLRMSDCLTCHRGLEKELEEETLTLGRCQTCHYATRPGIVPALGNVVAKPLSHTESFRRRHGEQAAADDGVCAACHTELAGDTGAECARCHVQARPRDHGPQWRNEPHGRAAARDADRCATCHARDRCADCHAEAPRDHAPRRTFLVRHGREARASLRRCQTCHLPQVDCARCHDVGGL